MIFRIKNIPLFVLMIFLPVLCYGKTDLPVEFKEIIPVYPTASVYSSQYTRNSVTVVFKSSDSYEKVLDYYTRSLSENGWKIQLQKNKNEAKTMFMSQTSHFYVILYGLNQISEKPAGYIIELQYPGGRE